jgi:hypothetical protein
MEFSLAQEPAAKQGEASGSPSASVVCRIHEERENKKRICSTCHGPRTAVFE